MRSNAAMMIDDRVVAVHDRDAAQNPVLPIPFFMKKIKATHQTIGHFNLDNCHKLPLKSVP
jgi:hypothetical protein